MCYSLSCSTNSTVELVSEASEDTMNNMTLVSDSIEMGEGEEVE
jgi:hypothetical protein